MKVAFLSREYPPDTSWGGIATVYHSLACALAQRGHEIHVICQATGKPKDLVDNGVFVHRVGTNPRRYSTMARINYSFHAWLKLREAIRKYRIEIVEATYWGAEASLYSLKKRTPLVIRADVSASDILRTKTYSGIEELLSLRILSCLERFNIKRADRVITISKEVHTRVIERLQIDPEKVDMVYPGIDTGRYRFIESDVREKLKISQNVPLVLFVGRLEARKGVHVLCQAVPEIIRAIPLTKFALVGEDTNTAPSGGSFKSYLTKKAKQNSFANNLLFIDFLPPEELIKLYSACDVVVLPSLQEGFSEVILEALACGKPIVTTSTGGAPEIGLTPPSGIIVPPHDVKDLAQAIIELLSLKDEEKRLAARTNRELVETRFSMAAWVDKMVQVYEKTLKGAT
jgi:glycogen(starch) synthase